MTIINGQKISSLQNNNDTVHFVSDAQAARICQSMHKNVVNGRIL